MMLVSITKITISKKWLLLWTKICYNERWTIQLKNYFNLRKPHIFWFFWKQIAGNEVVQLEQLLSNTPTTGALGLKLRKKGLIEKCISHYCYM